MLDKSLRLAAEIEAGIQMFNKRKAEMKELTGEEPSLSGFLTGWLEGGILEDKEF